MIVAIKWIMFCKIGIGSLPIIVPIIRASAAPGGFLDGMQPFV